MASASISSTLRAVASDMRIILSGQDAGPSGEAAGSGAVPRPFVGPHGERSVRAADEEARTEGGGAEELRWQAGRQDRVADAGALQEPRAVGRQGGGIVEVGDGRGALR